MQLPISISLPAGVYPDWFSVDFLVYFLLASVIAVCIATRIVTGARNRLRQPGQPALLVPYWIPYVGHAISLAFCRPWLMDKARNNAAPVVQLVVMGKTVNVVTSPALIASLSSKKNSSLERGFTDRLSDNLFGSQRSTRKIDEPGFPFTSSWVFLMDQSDAKDLCRGIVSHIQRNNADLVSCLTSPVDQYLWERSADIDIPADTSNTCTADLYGLVRGFVGVTMITHLMGTTFIEAYEVVTEDLFSFNTQVNAIALGLPRYCPFPGLVPAYSCRRRLLEGLTKFHQAFRMVEAGGDPGVEWRDFDDVSGFMQNRAHMYMDTGVSIEGAARQDLAMLWAMHTRISTLVFWLMVYISSNEERRVQTIQEADRFANITRPPPFGMFREPIKTSLDVDGLVKKCPLLNAVYYETLRLQSSEFAVRTMTRDHKCSETERPAECRLKKGDIFAYSCLLSNMDDSVFHHPTEFRPERFLSTDEDSNGDATDGVTRGDLQTLFCPDTEDETPREFKEECEEKIVLAFTVAIIMAYDITPEKGKWEIPSSRAAGLSNQPKNDIRVRIKPKN